MPGSDLPDKLFFKIGEVAQIVGVRPHVLRYWESEFPGLRPLKTRGAHRVYRRRDVELAVLLRRLLHEEGLTIAGAKRRLRENGQHRVARAPLPELVREVNVRSELLVLRGELQALLEALQSVFADKPTAAAEIKAEAGSRVACEAGQEPASAVQSNVQVQASRRPPV